jgi:hypothetical protein
MSEPSRPRLSHFLSAAVAAAFIVLGVAAAVAPDTVIASSRSLVSHAGIYAAAAVRSAMGIALLLIAPGSRGPAILRIMGLALLAMGLTMPIMGVDSARARIEWEAEHLSFLRMEGVLFVCAGIIAYAIARPRKK